jgi:O-antigen ligase
MTVLARMGVPGLTLWLFLQGAFAIGVLRAIRAHRRANEWMIAGLGAWVLIIWAAMMVDTSFDPYLEGPQGGIWFWAIVGLGLVVMRLAHRPTTQ